MLVAGADMSISSASALPLSPRALPPTSNLPLATAACRSSRLSRFTVYSTQNAADNALKCSPFFCGLICTVFNCRRVRADRGVFGLFPDLSRLDAIKSPCLYFWLARFWRG